MKPRHVDAHRPLSHRSLRAAQFPTCRPRVLRPRPNTTTPRLGRHRHAGRAIEPRSRIRVSAPSGWGSTNSFVSARSKADATDGRRPAAVQTIRAQAGGSHPELFIAPEMDGVRGRKRARQPMESSSGSRKVAISATSQRRSTPETRRCRPGQRRPSDRLIDPARRSRALCRRQRSPWRAATADAATRASVGRAHRVPVVLEVVRDRADRRQQAEVIYRVIDSRQTSGFRTRRGCRHQQRRQREAAAKRDRQHAPSGRMPTRRDAVDGRRRQQRSIATKPDARAAIRASAAAGSCAR